MTTVVFNYEGFCKGGPWDGQHIQGKYSFFRHETLEDGMYRWWRGEWLWCPRMGMATTTRPSA